MNESEKDMFYIDSFTNKYITKRQQSLFLQDIKANYDELKIGIENKSVLVIGGAGSIGASFIKSILQFKPGSLIVVDYNENTLAELTRDLRSTQGMFVPEEYIPYPIDCGSDIFKKMFLSRASNRKGGKVFDIVANFSAHKHVRSEKDIYSVEALIQNNILNAKRILDLLCDFPPEAYFCVSTDKAVNPVNIMGASKRIMEDVIFSYSDVFPVKTARFANVAFSNGSLPDGFLHRIAKLQPLSAPSDVRRYFVSPEESGQICMLASILGNNREIFFPKLQEAQMMTFDAIATALLNEHGFDVLECSSNEEALAKVKDLKNGSRLYPVRYISSITSGEKAYEEFYTETETVDLNRMDALGVVTGKMVPDKNRINALYDKLNKAFDENMVSKESIISIMQEYLPNFEHIETGRGLDGQM